MKFAFCENNSEDVEDDSNFSSSAPPISIAADNHSLKPIYSIGYWNDSDDTDNPRASGAILTFSGID